MPIQSGCPLDFGGSGMSPSAKPLGINLSIDNKKASKPLIEKRRRARINHSLSILKGIVVGTDKNNQSTNSRQPKLEKADILEMTVDFVKNLQEKSSHLNDYNSGFDSCLKAACSFLEQQGELSLKNRLLGHIGGNPPPPVHSTTGDDTVSCSSRSQTPTTTTSMDYASSSSSSSPLPDPEPSERTFSNVSHHQEPLDLAVREQQQQHQQLVNFQCGHSVYYGNAEDLHLLRCPYCNNVWRPW